MNSSWKSRDTVFSAGNEKLLYVPKQGRRRTASNIFDTHSFNPETKKKEQPATLETISEAKKTNFMRRNVPSETVLMPKTKAKGNLHRDLLNQSADSNTYGIFSARKRLDHPNKQMSSVSSYDLSSLKYHDVDRKNRVSRYMNSSSIKDSLTSPKSDSKPTMFTSSRTAAYSNSSNMQGILTSPTNATSRSLLSSVKVGDLNKTTFI